MSRSPLTGTVGDCSVGGALGTMLKRAGWDGILVTGADATPRGIEIDDHRVRVTDATALWGLDTEEVHARLSDRGSKVTIGTAAENGVRFASVMVDRHHAAGRNGLGLVFAAKRLKYITVTGTGPVAVADKDELKRAREDILRLIAASPVLMGECGLTHFGTGALYDLMHSRRMMPTDNFRHTCFAAAPVMNAHAYQQAYNPVAGSCRGCHIRCKRRTRDGQALPEFETMSHFSALLRNHDLNAVVEANRICNRLGMDTITAAATLACYAEVRRIQLSPAQILSLLQDIGRGRGEGRELGLGSAAWAAAHGASDTSMSVKGQELAAYDPRGAYGMALAYATSTRGACHLRAYPIGHEILRKPVVTNRFSFGGKARILKIAEDMNAMVDSLTACKFVFFNATLEEYARAYMAVTGVRSSAQELLHRGERICYHERIMNARNGFDADDDDLPERFFKEPGTAGNGIDVPPLDRDEFRAARQRYYRVRGLDANGVPTAPQAARLGLSWKR